MSLDEPVRLWRITGKPATKPFVTEQIAEAALIVAQAHDRPLQLSIVVRTIYLLSESQNMFEDFGATPILGAIFETVQPPLKSDILQAQ